MMDWKPLYPFASHWLDLDGVRYHYLDEGPRTGPPVVMVHGNPTWSFYYRTLIPTLAPAQRVIVPDHIGCGLSDKPQAYPYTLEQHIRNLERLVAHLGLSDLTLVMHDWGGPIGTGLAAMLSGVDHYVALDVIRFAHTEANLRILDELVTLFRRRAGRPRPGVLAGLRVRPLPDLPGRPGDHRPGD